MKSVIAFSLFAIVTTSGLAGYLFYFKPIWSSQYQTGQCFKDSQLQVTFEVTKVNINSYELVVRRSGHYEASPDFAKGTRLEYAKSHIDGNSNFHPNFCEDSENN